MMDDDTYDGIVERLRELDPRNPYLVESGLPPPDTLKEIFCMIGQRDRELEVKAIGLGLIMTTILSANTTVIVHLEDNPKESPKLRVAKELGIKILTRQQFINQYLS